jgi:hypothetical protein
MQWNKNSGKRQFPGIYKEKHPKPYTRIFNVQNIGFSSGSNAIRAVSRNGLGISPGLPCTGRHKSVKLKDNA